MYSSPFYITEPVGNNIFSYDTRTNKQLYVPSIISANTLDQIELGSDVVFEDIDENGKLQSCTGLKNFYEFEIFVSPDSKESGLTKVPLYLFDNHNHALYFWYLEKEKGRLKEKGNKVLHIDEHSDTRVPELLIPPLTKSLSSIEGESRQKRERDSPGGGLGKDAGKAGGFKELTQIFHYTNFIANVGNYMVPAQKEGLIGDIFQIRDEGSLEREYDVDILNLDLDFFTPRLEYIPYNKKKDFILKHIPKARIITVCTSPFFIDQTLALKVFRDIFSGYIK